MRNRTGKAWLWVLALGAGSLVPAARGEAARSLAGTVFDDRDNNGRQGRDEPGVAGVAMSNGRQIATTDVTGRYRLPVMPGQTVFAIQPAGWRLPGGDPARAGAWRHIAPTRPSKLKYGGMAASSTFVRFPARFDVALRRQPESDGWLEVRIFADPQVKSRGDVGYYGRDIVDSVLAEPAESRRPELGLSLGDIVDDALDLYPALDAETRRMAVPWHHVAGNHDLDFDAARDEDALLSFRNRYGPDTFAREEHEAVFIGIDNVIFRPGQKPNYIGGLREDQLAFLENYLPRVPKDRLLVLAMHIPLFELEGQDTFRDTDRERLFTLLDDFPHVLLLSGHSHGQRHWLHDGRTGWHGTSALHEYNVGAACGAYWSGVKDQAGIPDTTMADGTPNGYASLGIGEGGRYTLAWHVARDHRNAGIGLSAPKVLRRGAYPAHGVFANVYMGRDDSRVEYRIDDGPWQSMRKVLAADPRMLRENVLDADAGALRGYDLSPEAGSSPHLWRGLLPTDLAAGVHRIEVRAFDTWRGEMRAQGEYRLQDAKEQAWPVCLENCRFHRSPTREACVDGRCSERPVAENPEEEQRHHRGDLRPGT